VKFCLSQEDAQVLDKQRWKPRCKQITQVHLKKMTINILCADVHKLVLIVLVSFNPHTRVLICICYSAAMVVNFQFIWPRYNDFLVSFVTMTNTHNRFTALFPGPPRWAGARRGLLDFMVQRKINRGRHTDIRLSATPSGLTNVHLHHPPIFYRPDALPATQPTVSKHWRQLAHSD